VTYIIFENKICIHLARNPHVANFTEENILKISTNFLSTDRGWSKSKVCSSLRKLRELRFKMKDFPEFGFLFISTSENRKKVKTFIFLLFSTRIAHQKAPL